MEDRENRTEEATPKRLRDARKKGQVAKSGDLNAAVSFFVFTVMSVSMSQYVYTNCLRYLKNSLYVDFSREISIYNAGNMLINHLISFLLLMLPFMLLAMALGAGVSLAQVGFLYTTETLKPNFKKLNPIEGMKNIFSKKAALNLIKNIAKMFLIIFLTYKSIKGSIAVVENSLNFGSAQLFSYFVKFARDVGFNIAIVMLLLGFLDFVVERREYKKNLRMSKQQVRDEYKEMEGSPEIRSMRQRRQREIAYGRIMANMETATVVITNPNHIAVVLRYDDDIDGAPVVVAKGVDFLANKIKEKAKECNIPVFENKTLARTIYYEVEIGRSIPVKLYQAIAEILALIYQMEEKNKGRI